MAMFKYVLLVLMCASTIEHSYRVRDTALRWLEQIKQELFFSMLCSVVLMKIKREGGVAVGQGYDVYKIEYWDMYILDPALDGTR